MVKQLSVAGMFFLLFGLGAVVTGGAFYQYVLPRLQLPAPPPKPPPENVPLYSLTPAKATYVPQIAALPGTAIVRLAHQTSNTHQAWAFANMGKVTDPGSIFARHGITMEFRRFDPVADRIAELTAMAAGFNRHGTAVAANSGPAPPTPGVHFFTVGGDSSGRVLTQTTQALKTVNPDFEAEIIGFAGVSAGEDTFFGVPAWKRDPKSAIGAVVAGVPYSSAWNVMVFWCAQNKIPFNADQEYYDPNALNVVENREPGEAVQLYVKNTRVQRIFLWGGEDDRGRTVETGEKGSLAINGVALRTPWDRRLAEQRSGLVTIASTQQYPNQTPQFIVGLKQWNRQHQEIVVHLLAAIFDASQQIEKSQRDLTAGLIQPKSETDARWQAAQDVSELVDGASPEDWYQYYHVTRIKDKRGELVEIGGAEVSNLQRNLLFFGLGGAGPDRGQVVYDRFTHLAKQYDPNFVTAVPAWESVFSKDYIAAVLEAFPGLAQADPSLPVFAVESRHELPPPPPPPLPPAIYRLSFVASETDLGPEHEATLHEVMEHVELLGDVRIEIHAYTDSSGPPEYNLELSQRRGQSIYNWLKDNLAAHFPDDVQVVAHGEENLLINDQIGDQWHPDLMARNRRVVVKLFPLYPLSEKQS